MFWYFVEYAQKLSRNFLESLPDLSETEDFFWFVWIIVFLTILSLLKLAIKKDNWALRVKRENQYFSNLIIPSKCLRVARMGSVRTFNHSSFRNNTWATPGRTRIQSIVDAPEDPNWRPLLVFANRKSGNGLGSKVLDECASILHPLQVHDLSKSSPAETLRVINALPDQRFWILVCGGDGSVNWILAAIDALQPKLDPYIAVLPLGTGNDLSRCLSWGAGFTRFDTVRSTLHALKYAEPINIDRWKIKIQNLKQQNENSFLKKKDKGPKYVGFQNYFSVGVDAACALDFHRTRNADPVGILSVSRHFNKFFYALVGAKGMIQDPMHDLDKKLQIELDGKACKIPEGIQGILFLNIWSYGGGVPVWRQGLYLNDVSSIGECTGNRLDYGSMNDGKIEVLGFRGFFHLAQVQVNLSDAVRLGQAKTVKLTVNEYVPMQADGEAWMNEACVLELQNTVSRSMLLNKVDEKVRRREVRERNGSCTSLDSINTSFTDISGINSACEHNRNASNVRHRVRRTRNDTLTPLHDIDEFQGDGWDIQFDQI